MKDIDLLHKELTLAGYETWVFHSNNHLHVRAVKGKVVAIGTEVGGWYVNYFELKKSGPVVAQSHGHFNEFEDAAEAAMDLVRRLND